MTQKAADQLLLIFDTGCGDVTSKNGLDFGDDPARIIR